MRLTVAAALFALVLVPASAGARSHKTSAATAAPTGNITREAYIKNDTAHAASLAGRRFDAIDTAHKGVVTRKQYLDYYEGRAEKYAGQRFDQMDTDHNGVLEPSEVAAWRAAHHRHTTSSASH